MNLKLWVGICSLTWGIHFCFAASTLEKIKLEKKLRVGLQQNYIPFNMKKPDGTWVGFEIEMLQDYCKHSGGLSLEIQDTKWEAIIPALVSKKFDVIVSGMTITDERSKAVLFSHPYLEVGQKILVRKQLSLQKAESLDESGRKIAVQLGTTGDFVASKFFKKAELVRVDTEHDGANSVLLGKLDAFVGDNTYVDVFSKRNASKVTVISDLLSKEGLGLAARKQDKALVDDFNLFLSSWITGPRFKRLFHFYFEELGWLKEFPHL